MDALAHELGHSKDPLHAHRLQVVVDAEEVPDLPEALLDVVHVVLVQKILNVHFGHLFSVWIAVVAHQIEHFGEIRVRLVKAAAF